MLKRRSLTHGKKSLDLEPGKPEVVHTHTRVCVHPHKHTRVYVSYEDDPQSVNIQYPVLSFKDAVGKKSRWHVNLAPSSSQLCAVNYLWMLSFTNAHVTADPLQHSLWRSWDMQTSGRVDTFPMGNNYRSGGLNQDVGPS